MKKLLELLNKKGIKYLIQDNKITIDGNLNLRNRGIKALPKNFFIGGSLYLGFTEIEALPENFSIKDDLDLKYSKIKILPENLSIGGKLNIESTSIRELPDNLSVGTGLYLDIDKIQNIAYCKNCEDNSQTIFACWVNNGFAIQMNDFFGTFQEFEKMVDEKYSGKIAIEYKKLADTCIKELTEKLKIL
jgi:hypothetical protein